MHELAIAGNIIKIVVAETDRLGIINPVEKVVFRAGRMNAIIPDSLKFNFDILKKDAPLLLGAVLEIHEIPVKAACTACLHEFELQEPLFICPRCHAPARPLAGAPGASGSSGASDMFVESIVVKEG